MRFIEFLMQPDVVEEYAEQQLAIPTLEGVTNDDPALAGVRSYIEEGRTVGFFDHQFIPAIPLAPLLQQYLIDRDAERFLGGLDDNWDKVAARRTWSLLLAYGSLYVAQADSDIDPAAAAARISFFMVSPSLNTPPRPLCPLKRTVSGFVPPAMRYES